ncbi:MAG: porin [Janthinobacterium lividum]
MLPRCRSGTTCGTGAMPARCRFAGIAAFAAFALTVCLPVTTQAQSALTVYGVADVSVRHLTNANGGDVLALSPGGLQGSRVGFKGTEDLGAGLKAQFVLESGFVVDTGASDQQGQLFGRQAWVSVGDEAHGTLSAGRIYGVPFTFLGIYDPLWIGNYLESSYLPRIVGTRFDNSLAYSYRLGGFDLQLVHAFGEQAGDGRKGASSALGLQYATANLTFGGVAQRSLDANEKALTILGAGANYKLGRATLYVLYVNARREAGFAVIQGPGQALANTSLLGNANTALGPATQTGSRTDSYASAGVGYQIGPAIYLTAGMAIDNVRNAAADTGGKIRTGYLVANYAFSKRTDVYIAADRNLLSGASVTDPNNPVLGFGGQSNRTGIGVGLRTRF